MTVSPFLPYTTTTLHLSNDETLSGKLYRTFHKLPESRQVLLTSRFIGMQHMGEVLCIIISPVRHCRVVRRYYGIVPLRGSLAETSLSLAFYH
jgi:hypothetical protein